MQLQIVILAVIVGVSNYATAQPPPPGTCKYLAKCVKKVIKGKEIMGLCKETAACEERFRSWSSCTSSCGGGIRRRFGFCIASGKCKIILKQQEACNTQSCGGVSQTPPPVSTGTTPPPPPPTTSDGTVFGGWSSWEEWSAYTACDQSCCGGTQSRFRTRICTNLPPVRNELPCIGSSAEAETQTCNTQVCPLSCVGVVSGTTYNDPCVVCSARYYACAGADTPVEIQCPTDTVWSQNGQECRAECDNPSK